MWNSASKIVTLEGKDFSFSALGFFISAGTVGAFFLPIKPVDKFSRLETALWNDPEKNKEWTKKMKEIRVIRECQNFKTKNVINYSR